MRELFRFKKSTPAEPAAPISLPTGIVPCPGCHKATAPQFMWGFQDGTYICLACFHKMPETQQEMHRKSALKTESKSAGYAMKSVAILGLTAVVLGGSICVFYKPHPTQIAKRAVAPEAQAPARKPVESSGSAGGAPKAADGKDETGGEPPSEKSAENKAEDDKAKSDNGTLAVDGPKGDGKQHVAPTVSAVSSKLPTKRVEAKADAAAPSSVKAMLEQAQAAADALKPDAKDKKDAQDKTADAGGVPPDTFDAVEAKRAEKKAAKKAEAEKTRAAALNVASTLIEKHDKDGTKTAEALAKLGQISTAFADVATKLTDGVPTSSGKSNSSATSGGPPPRLGSDTLAAQGQGGYDPGEAVRRELEEAGAEQKTIRMDGDPNARSESGLAGPIAKGLPVTVLAAAVPGTRSNSHYLTATNSIGMVQNTAAVPVESLPWAFTAAERASSNPGEAGAAEVADRRVTELPVVVMSMQGDLSVRFQISRAGGAGGGGTAPGVRRAGPTSRAARPHPRLHRQQGKSRGQPRAFEEACGVRPRLAGFEDRREGREHLGPGSRNHRSARAE